MDMDKHQQTPPISRELSADMAATIEGFKRDGYVRTVTFYPGTGAEAVLAPGFYGLEYGSRVAVLAVVSSAAVQATGESHVRLVDPYTNKKVGYFLDGTMHLDGQ